MKRRTFLIQGSLITTGYREMNKTDYRIGRASTIINKYVSSAACLKGKKLVSYANQGLAFMGIIGQRPILLVVYVSNVRVLLDSVQSLWGYHLL